jgi:4-methylaminobutanoate oxidase (formaldehyde-forming)
MIDHGAKPAGLFAQTSMRIEKRFLAYGHDLDTDISPVHTGLLRTVNFDTNFIGREALLRQQQQPTELWTATLVLDNRDAVPMGSEPVYSHDEIIGKSTFAAFGYRVGKPVALVAITNHEIITALQQRQTIPAALDIAGKRFSGELMNDPAWK